MKKNTLRLIAFILALLICWNLGLAADEKPDYWPTKGWRTASPESQGVDSNLLENMLNKLWKNDLAIESVIVVRNGYIVMDAYSYPRDLDRKNNIRSCAKSIISALIGIAIDKGYIKDVNQPVLDFFPNRVAKNIDANKKAMTLENLLTMTTGLEWRDGGIEIYQMRSSEDWVQFMIDLPMAEVPGVRFEYCNGASFLLSAILQEQTGMNALTFANKHLFGPLGISKVSWSSNSEGITIGYSGLHMRPQDMAKIGYLFLNDGLWDGKKILSSEWINTSTRRHISATSRPGREYGYKWWIVNPNLFAAMGSYGQFIIVDPKTNLIVVFTSRLSHLDAYIPFVLLNSYILPAIKSPISLPENPNKKNALKSAITRWENTSPFDRRKIIRAEKSSQSIKLNEYINEEYGFSAKYDAELLSLGSQLSSPFVFKRRGLSGRSEFTVFVDDIPQGMKLEKTGNYIIDRHKRRSRITNSELKKEELINLSDGTNANYFEITWRYKSLEMLTVGVFAYRNNKIIGVVASSKPDTPIEYLSGMAKSLRFNK